MASKLPTILKSFTSTIIHHTIINPLDQNQYQPTEKSKSTHRKSKSKSNPPEIKIKINPLEIKIKPTGNKNQNQPTRNQNQTHRKSKSKSNVHLGIEGHALAGSYARHHQTVDTSSYRYYSDPMSPNWGVKENFRPYGMPAEPVGYGAK
jgi:hypothetical protein